MTSPRRRVTPDSVPIVGSLASSVPVRDGSSSSISNAPPLTNRTFLAPSGVMTAHPTSASERDRGSAKLSTSKRYRDELVGDSLLLTPEEAARVLGIGRTTVFALMKAGELRPVHIGRSCRLSRAELERYVGSLQAPPQPPPTRARQRRRATTTGQRGLFDLIHIPPEEP